MIQVALGILLALVVVAGVFVILGVGSYLFWRHEVSGFWLNRPERVSRKDRERAYRIKD